MYVRDTENTQRLAMIVPDYQRPAAVMVPHYPCDLTPLLESIATRTAESVGVILLSRDPEFTASFLATQPYPERFTVITAPLDSPWIRDRSPIAIREGKTIRWCIPRYEYKDRPNDNALFARICAANHPIAPIDYLPQGNLVAGSQGLAFVTTDVLKKNSLTLQDIQQHNCTLGIKQWLTFSGFRREQTGHADIHLRVLKPNLFAVAWNLSSQADRHASEKIIRAIKSARPSAHVLKIPIRSHGDRYASLVNWLQLGKRLLIPRYALTTAEDIRTTQSLLSQQGFRCEFIYSPTLDIQGSLHCLTGSIFV